LNRHLTAFCALLIALTLPACSSHGMQSIPMTDASSGNQGGIQPFDAHGGIPTSSVTVTMQDAAPVISGKQLAHFNVAIREIDVTDSKGRTQVVAQYSTPLVVDVLKYQSGTGANVGQTVVTDQTYRQIRFLVDIAASQAIFTDNSVAPLTFISRRDTASDARAGKSTVTVPVGGGLVSISDTRQFTIGANASELVTVDFNLFESLAPAGGSDVDASNAHGGIPTTSSGLSGGLTVRPTLFVAANSSAGQLTGRVVNQNGDPVSGAVVVAVGQGNTVGNSAATDASGNFELHALAAGSYRLDVYNQYTNAAGAQFTSHGATSEQDVIRGPNITVTPGLTSSTGTVTD
jgi:hypothetical protein